MIPPRVQRLHRATTSLPKSAHVCVARTYSASIASQLSNACNRSSRSVVNGRCGDEAQRRPLPVRQLRSVLQQYVRFRRSPHHGRARTEVQATLHDGRRAFRAWLLAQRGRILAQADAAGCPRGARMKPRRPRAGTPSVLRVRSRRSNDPDYTPGRFTPGHAAARRAAYDASQSANLVFVSHRKS